ncbi:MAG: sll1863 family stress response protein [Elusimicrobiales bacterium]
MGKKEEYMDKLNAQLKALGDRIDEFTEKAEHEALEHKTKLLREIEEFNTRRLEAQFKLRQMKETTGDAWETLVAGMDKAWADMKETVRQIAEKFKQPR